MSSSIGVWVLYSLLVGAAVAGAALAADDAQRTRKRSTRWIWFGAMPLIIGLSVIAPLRRIAEPTSRTPSSVTSAHSQTNNAVGELRQSGRWFSALRQSLTWPVKAVLRFARDRVVGIPSVIAQAFIMLWVLASFVTLGYFAAGYLRVRRLVKKWPVDRVAAESVRVSPATGPAVVGLMPSEIVVPEWLRARPLGEQSLVVAHEREHVSAGDPWLLVIACAAVAVMPWHPALWFALRRLQLAAELDCDNRMLSSGVSACSYGSLLIELSAVRSSLPMAVPAFICHSSHLERRLVAMTSRVSRFAAPRSIAGGLLALSALAVACSSDLSTASELTTMNGKAAIRTAQRVALIDSTHVRYFVDGQSVSSAAANAVDASQIADIEVKRSNGGAPAEVRIDTRSAQVSDAVVSREPTVDAVADSSPTQRVVYRMGSSKSQPLFVLDGKIVDDMTRLNALRPDQIASIEVLKGAAATQAYKDVRAEQGVIKVTTRENP